MALGFYFAPAAMSAAQYDECIKQLKKAGAGHPVGRSYHACFGPSCSRSTASVWSVQTS